MASSLGASGSGGASSELKESVRSVLAGVAGAVRASNALPKRGELWELVQSYPKVAELLKVESGRCEALLSSVCRGSGVRFSLAGPPGEGTEEKLDRLVDANDALLERVSSVCRGSGVRFSLAGPPGEGTEEKLDRLVDANDALLERVSSVCRGSGVRFSLAGPPGEGTEEKLDRLVDANDALLERVSSVCRGSGVRFSLAGPPGEGTEEKLDRLVDANDALLERVSSVCRGSGVRFSLAGPPGEGTEEKLDRLVDANDALLERVSSVCRGSGVRFSLAGPPGEGTEEKLDRLVDANDALLERVISVCRGSGVRFSLAGPPGEGTEEKLDRLVDANDALLERVSSVCRGSGVRFSLAGPPGEGTEEKLDRLVDANDALLERVSSVCRGSGVRFSLAGPPGEGTEEKLDRLVDANDALLERVSSVCRGSGVRFSLAGPPGEGTEEKLDRLVDANDALLERVSSVCRGSGVRFSLAGPPGEGTEEKLDRLVDANDALLERVSSVCRGSGVRFSLAGPPGEGTEEKLDRLVDANDALLERVGNLLDEADGVRRKPKTLVVEQTADEAQTAAWNRGGVDLANLPTLHPSPQLRAKAPTGPVRLLTARNIPRPQLAFQETIDNSNTPFVSKLREKHHALPRKHGNVVVHVDGEEVGPEACVDQDDHPYQYELEHFEVPEAALARRDPKVPKPLDQSPPVRMVAKPAELLELLEHLLSVDVFACDLEHHGYRTFLGLTCLMQITTQEGGDFIVDTLALWKEMHCLNEAFAHPRILKVLHGADHDVLWLQRDFGIYIVNLFDTGKAMRALGMGRYGLGHLVQHYAGVGLEKKYQLADWRMRPLPEELVAYARSDTHFLLYCADRLHNDLLGKSSGKKRLRQVWTASKALCLSRYEKPLLKPDDHLALYNRSKGRFDNRQMRGLESLYAWRDRTARLEDESTAFVLPDHMLLQMAQILPKELSGVLACCNPVPPLVRTSQQEIHRLILAARDLPQGPKPKVAPAPAVANPKASRLNSLPLDFSHVGADEHVKPLALRLKGLSEAPRKRQSSDEAAQLHLRTKLAASLSAFDSSSGDSDSENRRQRLKEARAAVAALAEGWASPYERFQLAEAVAEEKVPVGVGSVSLAKDASGKAGLDDDGLGECALLTEGSGTQDDHIHIKEERPAVEEEGEEAGLHPDQIDMAGSSGEEGELDDGPPPEKRRKKAQKNKFGRFFEPGQLDMAAGGKDFQPVDYGAMGQGSLERGPRKGRQDVYDPFKAGKGGGGRGGGRGRGDSRGRGRGDSRGRGGGGKRGGDRQGKTFTFSNITRGRGGKRGN